VLSLRGAERRGNLDFPADCELRDCFASLAMTCYVDFLQVAFSITRDTIGTIMKRMIFTTLFCGSLLLLPGMVFPFDGPLQVRNQFPLFLPLAPPFLESSAVQDSASVSVSHSSVYVTEYSSSWTVNMDFELTELAVRLKKRIGDRTEIGLDVPFLRPTEGFLDRPLEVLHDTLGTRDYGRHERPYNEFLYELKRNGQPIIKAESGTSGVGDMRLTLKREVTAGLPLVSVMGSLELPTGDAKTGYGNGSYDASLAALVDFDLGKTYRGHGNAGVVFPGALKAYQTVPMRTYYYAGFGIEAAWWERFSVIVQTMVASSPYPSTGIRQVDWPGILLTFGGRYSYGTGSLEFSLTEDPDTAGAPDFILNVTGKMNF
jgi:hypothetical protein